MASIHAFLILAALGVGCSETKKDVESDLEGRWSGASHSLPEIKSRPLPVIKEFAEGMARSVGRASIVGTSSTPVVRRSLLAASYLRAVSDIGGLPRSQGETVLRQILAPTSTACGGTSCARVFDLDDELISPFMSAMTIKSALDTKLLEPKNRAMRGTLLASLRPDQEIRKADSFELHLASIASDEPSRIGLAVPVPDTILPNWELNRLGGTEFVHAVHGYTGAAYTHIRKVDALNVEEIHRSGMNVNSIRVFKGMLTAIKGGLAKLPEVKQTVYRGIKDVPREQISQWISMWQDGKPLGLGLRDQAGLGSATWDPGVALKFADKGNIFKLEKRYGVIFEITDHQGVSIQNISEFPSEREVLIPALMFKIESIRLLKDRPGVFHIQIKGIHQARQARYGDKGSLLVA